jgi:hypothetical protein
MPSMVGTSVQLNASRFSFVGGHTVRYTFLALLSVGALLGHATLASAAADTAAATTTTALATTTTTAAMIAAAAPQTGAPGDIAAACASLAAPPSPAVVGATTARDGEDDRAPGEDDGDLRDQTLRACREAVRDADEHGMGGENTAATQVAGATPGTLALGDDRHEDEQQNRDGDDGKGRQGPARQPGVWASPSPSPSASATRGGAAAASATPGPFHGEPVRHHPTSTTIGSPGASTAGQGQRNEHGLPTPAEHGQQDERD